jgi:hypothetical protein
MDIERIELESMDWIHQARYKIQWRALLNTVMKFGSNKILENS